MVNMDNKISRYQSNEERSFMLIPLPHYIPLAMATQQWRWATMKFPVSWKFLIVLGAWSILKKWNKHNKIRSFIWSDEKYIFWWIYDFWRTLFCNISTFCSTLGALTKHITQKRKKQLSKKCQILRVLLFLHYNKDKNFP